MNLAKFVILAIISSAVTLPGTAFSDAEPKFLTASDTGIMFGDLDCKIISAEVDPEVTVSEDSFNYLFATVKASLTCVDRAGVQHQFRSQDSVWFPTVDFDWRTQEWRFAATPVARRSAPYGLVLQSGISARVSHFVDETHLSFSVELWSE